MAITFPSNPSIGDEYTAGGFTWIWTGSSWSKAVAATGGVANDFTLLVGATGNTTYVLDRTYTAGRYTIDFVNDDTSYDIYFIAEDGTYAGYTNSSVAVVTADFSEVVVIGATNNETILFTYQGTATTPSAAGDVATAGAYINSVVTTSLPNANDTTVVNGGNFAANVQVHFIGQNAAVTAAKTVVRTSSTQLLVTRPDSFAVAQSPYTVRVTNPGIPVPAGSNAHLLSNAVTVGTNPVWITGTTIVYNVGAATNITLEASDTEASDIDYTLVSGTLPTGLTLNEETGVISGTFSGAANEGDVTSITIRATDAGGNFLDRTFSLTANAAPTWTTAAGALDSAASTVSYSKQLVASTGSFGGALTYSLQSGTLPAGLTLNSSGLISGASSETIGTTRTFTVRVSDTAGLFADRTFSIQTISNLANVTLNRSSLRYSGSTWGYGGNNSDAIAITFSNGGKLRGFGWQPVVSGSGTISGNTRMEAWSGSTFGSGTLLATKSLTGVSINEATLFFDTPVDVGAGQTVAFGIVWGASQGFSTYQNSGNQNVFSSVGTLNQSITFTSVSYAGGAYSDNGTSAGGGQIPIVFVSA